MVLFRELNGAGDELNVNDLTDLSCELNWDVVGDFTE